MTFKLRMGAALLGLALAVSPMANTVSANNLKIVKKGAAASSHVRLVVLRSRTRTHKENPGNDSDGHVASLKEAPREIFTLEREDPQPR